MDKVTAEFKVNQEVVFAPYGDRLQAKVLEVREPKDGEDRVFYLLSLIKTGFKTLCTGKCIEGSELFEGEEKMVS